MSQDHRHTSPPFTWWRAYRGPHTERLFVTGELDIATAPELARALWSSRAYGRVVELDLSGVEFIESSAIHVILEAIVRSRDADQRLILLGGRPEIDRLFRLVGVPDEELQRSA